MMMYHTGARLCIQNEDDMQLNATIDHIFTLNTIQYALITYETGVTVSITIAELDQKVVYDW